MCPDCPDYAAGCHFSSNWMIFSLEPPNNVIWKTGNLVFNFIIRFKMMDLHDVFLEFDQMNFDCFQSLPYWTLLSVFGWSHNLNPSITENSIKIRQTHGRQNIWICFISGP